MIFKIGDIVRSNIGPTELFLRPEWDTACVISAYKDRLLLQAGNDPKPIYRPKVYLTVDYKATFIHRYLS